MWTLVLVFCLLPTRCIEDRPYEPMPIMQCVAMERTAVAQHLAEHPGWQLVEGRCEQPGKRIIELPEEWPRPPQREPLWR
jgi:hypothetical protein